MTDEPITPEWVIACLEDAARTSAAMDEAGFTTALVQTSGPAATGRNPAYPRPSAEKISAMDTIFSWVNYIPQYNVRRIVQLRAKTHPQTEKPTAWRAIARAIGWNPAACKRWHAKGINQIVKEISR